MRRERIIALLAMLVAVAGFTLLAPGRAAAATPQQICNDLIAHGGTTGTTYSQGDVDAYRQALQSDPTIQGYCPPLVIVTPTCVEVAAGTPNSVQAQNGKSFLNAPNGNAEACTTPPAQCTAVPANTPGATRASNGTWYANAPNGNANACAPQAECTVVPANTPGATQASNGTWYVNLPLDNVENCVRPASIAPAAAAPTAGVAGTTKVKQAPAATPVAAVSPSTHTTRSASPLGTTRSSGTLPFTGMQLGVFAVVGVALLAGGLLLRATGRKHPDAS